jgi:predicted PurR-regulated permease PerM
MDDVRKHAMAGNRTELAADELEADELEGSAIAGRPRASVPLVVLSVIAVLAAMYVARDALIPVVLAILLALLLRPLMRRMRAFQLPDVLSSLVLVAGVAAVFIVAVLMLAGEAQSWLAHAPQTIEKVRQLLPAQAGPLQSIQETTAAVEEMGRADGQQAPMEVKLQSSDMAYRLLGVSGHIAGSALVVFVLGFFLLAFSNSLLKQAIALQPSFGDKRSVVQVLQEVESGISRYLYTITAINIGLGIATGVALWLLGVPNPALWGVLATVANYVPHVGAFACLVILFCVGAVTHESLAYGLLVGTVFSALTSAESYFITPLVLSRSLQLSPLAVILAILFWGWLWGIAGGLMAAPLLAVAKITCDQFPAWQQFSLFLGGEVPAANGGNEKGPVRAQQAA